MQDAIGAPKKPDFKPALYPTSQEPTADRYILQTLQELSRGPCTWLFQVVPLAPEEVLGKLLAANLAIFRPFSLSAKASRGTTGARLQPHCFFERCRMSEPTEISVAGFSADVCEPAELRHRVLNGVPRDFAFEVTKRVDSVEKVVVPNDKWSPGKIGEIDCQMRGVTVAGAKAQGRILVTIKEISDSRPGER
jgi:hypothetical protein